VAVGSALAPLGFTIGDAETAPANLTVSGSSSNQALDAECEYCI
jgi:hypothetical protein